MPPLDAREKFPALTSQQREKLLAWIDAGADWPKDVKLKVPSY